MESLKICIELWMRCNLYRFSKNPPELLLTEKSSYSLKIDIWDRIPHVLYLLGLPPVEGKGRSAIAERDTVELFHGLAQGLHVVRDEVGPTVRGKQGDEGGCGLQLLRPVGSQGGFLLQTCTS